MRTSDGFPGVGQVMQGVTGVDDVGRLTGVLVGEEPRLRHLDVVQTWEADPGEQVVEHDWGDDDSDHARRRALPRG